jgi:ankyrin repeat protein
MGDANGDLIKACLAKDAKATTAALQAGASPDATDFPGPPALHIAIRLKAKSVIKALVQAGANPNAKDGLGRTALRFMAESFRDVPVATILIEKGAELDRSDTKKYEGHAPLHFAVKAAKLDFAELLLEKGADINVKDAEKGETPLHHLCRSNSGVMSNTEIANALWLMEKGADVSARSKDGTTPLHLAATTGSHKVLDALLERGAKPALTDLAHSPLHLCVHTNDRDTWIWDRLLQAGNPLDTKDAHGSTPLMRAQTNWNVRAVRYLLDKGADASVTDATGKTLLERATELKQEDILKALAAHGA